MVALPFSGFGDVATWVSVAFTIVTAVIAATAFVLLRKRERRQALTELHDSLTSGETARARHTLGSLLYSTSDADRPGRRECIEAYFVLIWALQRARNVFRAFGIPWERLDARQSRLTSILKNSSKKKDATIALTWNLVEVAENIVEFRYRYHEKWSIADADAWADVSTFIDAESLRRRITEQV